jgi:hypothetical protein
MGGPLKPGLGLSGWKSDYDGEFAFDLASLPGVSASDYSLAIEYVRDGRIVSRGYPLKASIKDTGSGKQIVALGKQPSEPSPSRCNSFRDGQAGENGL